MKTTTTTRATKKKSVTKKPLTRAEWIKLFIAQHKTALTSLAQK